jgi:hypothetical protein
VLLERRRRARRAKEAVEALEGALRPDAKAPQVAAGRELQQVQAVDVREVDAGNVAEGVRELGLLRAVDNERPAALREAERVDSRKFPSS